MNDTDILILLSFHRHVCLSESQMGISAADLEESLKRLVGSGALVRDMERLPVIFYRLTFLGTLSAAEAKRQAIRKDRAKDGDGFKNAKGIARMGFPIPERPRPDRSGWQSAPETTIGFPVTR